MSIFGLFLFVSCSTVLICGYQLFVGEGDTECMNNPGSAVVQPGTGCKQFLLCDDEGLAFGPQDCAHGTLFDQDSQDCLRSDDVNCFEVGEISSTDCVTAAVRGDCQRFTQCVLGRQVEKACGNGTVYSNSLHVCVYAEGLTDQQRLECEH